VFLTTNFAGSISPSVISRVHIHLTFSNLTIPMRAQVWNNFVERLSEDEGILSPDDVKRLSLWKMNGREIKNAINLSVAWCRKKNLPLTVEAVEDLIPLVNPTASNEQDGQKQVNGEHVNGTKIFTPSDELGINLLDI
jgi:hypothetical protein